MAEAKTKPTGASVDAFLARVPKAQLREDCRAVARIMTAATKAPAVMWGPSIVGFGQFRYKYASGREGVWPLAAFAPRGSNLVLYVMPGFEGYDDLLNALGPHSRGVSCIYVKRLSDLHMPTLKKLIAASVKHTTTMHVPAGPTTGSGSSAAEATRRTASSRAAARSGSKRR
jgi:hypothetical protein